jgi:hypothetical protein
VPVFIYELFIQWRVKVNLHQSCVIDYSILTVW